MSDLDDLARRLVLCERFYEAWTPYYEAGMGSEPDLTDPATAGVLLSLLAEDHALDVRRLLSGQRVVTVWRHDETAGLTSFATVDVVGTTLGEAAGRALLALWEAE